MTRFIDLTGEVIGTYRGVCRTEKRDPAGEALWLFQCACGRTRLMSNATVRNSQRGQTVPRCGCEAYRALMRARGYARRCGLCRLEGHRIADCPKRKPAKYSCPCAGLSHRVQGIRCSCGRRYAPEKPVELDVSGFRSSAGRLEIFALGGDTGDAQNRRPSKRKAAA